MTGTGLQGVAADIRRLPCEAGEPFSHEQARWRTQFHHRGAPCKVARKYEYIEHTGDVGFKAYGATCKELFVNAAEALFEVLVCPEGIREKERRTIEVESPALDGLMVSWLGELLYLFDVEGLLLSRFEIKSMQQKRLRDSGAKTLLYDER